MTRVPIDLVTGCLEVARPSSLAQTDYQSGHGPMWYVIVGLLMLMPMAALVLAWLISARRQARVVSITQALGQQRRITVFELARRLGSPDPEKLWAELGRLSRSGQLRGYELDDSGRAIERHIPPDPWGCTSCGGSNDGRNNPSRCEFCDSYRP